MEKFKVSLGDKELQEVKKIDIVVQTEKRDVEYRITLNKFGELEIQKQSYNEESSTLAIMPSVSNNIKIL